MIISKTPFRISFFGGGTDIEPYFNKYGGCVLSTTFNKYCYVTARTLPPFFDYNTHLTYNKTEQVTDLDFIEHPLIRNAMKYMDISNLRLVFDADIPARSGVASSSSFAVGLLNCFYRMKGEYASKDTLAKDAIYIERELCKEVGGWQDQIAVSYGGFNRIDFDENGFKVKKINANLEKLEDLNKNLLLYFTGFTRNSFEIQASNFDVKNNIDLKNLTFSDEKIKIYDKMKHLVDEAVNILEDDTKDLNEFGELLNETWNLKKQTGKNVSNDKIDKIYEDALRSGAIGGKILGAGGGGFIVFYVPIEKQKEFKINFSDKLLVPFSFENDGTKIIHDTGV